MESLKNIQTLVGHSDRIWYLSWHPDGNLLASCSGDKTIKLWKYSQDSESWVCAYTIADVHERTIRRISWSPCGTLLASAGFDSLVRIWTVEISEQITIDMLTDLDSHSYEVKAVAFSPSGHLLGTCARDKTVQLWTIDDDYEFMNEETLHSHTEDVKCLCWHPLAEMLVSGSYDNTIKLYTPVNGLWELLTSLNGHSSTVWQVSFNAAGDILASCSSDSTVRLWVCLDKEFTKWINATILEGYHGGVIYDISWSSGNLLSSVSEDNSVCVYRIGDSDRIMNGDTGSGIEVELLTRVIGAHDEDLNCCAWRPGTNGPCHSTVLATGSDDCSIKLWRFTDPDLPID